MGKNFCLATIITRDTLLFHSQQKMDKKLCCCGCRKVAKWFSNTLCNLVPHPLYLTGHKHLSVKYGLTFRSSQSQCTSSKRPLPNPSLFPSYLLTIWHPALPQTSISIYCFYHNCMYTCFPSKRKDSLFCITRPSIAHRTQLAKQGLLHKLLSSK